MAAVLLCPSLFGLEGFMAGLAGGGGRAGTAAKAAGETQGCLRRAENKTGGRWSEPPRGRAVTPLAWARSCLWLREGDSTARVTLNKEISWLYGQAGDQAAPRPQEGINLPSFQAGRVRNRPLHPPRVCAGP